MKRRNWLVAISVCLAFGGIGNVIVICFLIGFGLHTVVGKEALYVAFALQLGSLLACHFSERRLSKGRKAYTPSKKMRRVRNISTVVWALGALLLILSLVLAILGISFANFWVQYPCVIGAILAPLGWIGLLLVSHYRHQAIAYVNA